MVRMGREAPEPAASGELPARLRHTGNETGGSKLAKRQAGNLETANKSAAAAAHLATIHHPGRAGVAGQLRETDIVLLRLQLRPQRGVFLRRLALAIVAVNPRGLRHKERGS